MKHGGCVYKYNNPDGILDYSSNINPIKYDFDLNECKEDLYRYPDIEYTNLKNKLAKYLGCSVSSVSVSNGAVELIDAFVSLFKRVVVFTPCFSEYQLRAEARGKEILKLKLNFNFNLELEELKYIKEGDILVLGNPNNPTGKRIEKEKLKIIYEICKKRGAYLLLDEAFYEFVDDYDSIEMFKDKEGVSVIRAATKFFSLPGIRLGYAYVSRDIKEKIDNILLPWTVNSVAAFLAQKFLQDTSYIKNSKEFIKKEREFFLLELKKLKEIYVYDTQSNFILIKLLEHDEDTIFQRMLTRNILIRKCSTFYGLNKNYIRIAIKDRKSNLIFLNAFREALYD